MNRRVDSIAAEWYYQERALSSELRDALGPEPCEELGVELGPALGPALGVALGATLGNELGAPLGIELGLLLRVGDELSYSAQHSGSHWVKH
jgi:hypothetical protein